MSDRYRHTLGVLGLSGAKSDGLYIEGPSAGATDGLLMIWNAMGGWREKGITDFNLAISYHADKTVRFELTHPGQDFRKGRK